MGLALLLAGLVAIIAGLALWSPPAAIVVGGVELVFLSTLYQRGAPE